MRRIKDTLPIREVGIARVEPSFKKTSLNVSLPSMGPARAGAIKDPTPTAASEMAIVTT